MTVVDAHAGAAPARAALWGRLAELVSFPTAALAGEVADGTLAAALRTLVGALPYPLPLDGAAFTDPGAEREYIRLFDMPVDGPTVPLYGGLYGGDRRQVWEELLRFYRHFGLTTAGAATRDLPDSLATVLEFLQVLATIEAGGGAAAARTAQHDVLDRHVTRWTPAMLERLADRRPPPLYRAGLELVHGFAAAERDHLAGSASDATSGPTGDRRRWSVRL